jgi:hypothetical protein
MSSIKVTTKNNFTEIRGVLYPANTLRAVVDVNVVSVIRVSDSKKIKDRYRYDGILREDGSAWGSSAIEVAANLNAYLETDNPESVVKSTDKVTALNAVEEFTTAKAGAVLVVGGSEDGQMVASSVLTEFNALRAAQDIDTGDVTSSGLIKCKDLNVNAANSSSFGLVIDGGLVGSSDPKITTNGFNNIRIDKNLVLENQTKIAFDTDVINTFIAADLTTPENLTINAEGYVDVFMSNGFRVWEDVSAPSKVFAVEKDIDGYPNVAIGLNATATKSTLFVDGSTESDSYVYDKNREELPYQGEVVMWGTTATTAGRIYYWSGSSWLISDVTSQNSGTSLLAIAVSDNSSKGMLVKGWYKAPSGLANGRLYLGSSTGTASATSPSTPGNVVRVIGYGMNELTFRFDPSTDYSLVS